MIIEVSTVIDAPIENVWPLLDDFTSWHRWLTLITATAMEEGLDQGPVGSVRLMTTPGGTGRERLLAKDTLNQTLSYSIEPEPPLVRSYTATVRVEPVTTDGSTFVQWSSVIDSDAADESTVREAYESNFNLFLNLLRKAAEAKDQPEAASHG